MADTATHSEPTVVALTRRLESTAALDSIVGLVQPVSDALLSDRGRSSLLRGMWLGHAVHPIMTFIPLGTWTSATVLDLVGGASARPAAQRLIAAGIVGTPPTVLTGLAEFGPIARRDKRVAAVHALSNTVALTFFTASWRARRRGAHGKGVALALTGHLATGLGGYLGGHLTEARKVASRHPAYDDTDD